MNEETQKTEKRNCCRCGRGWKFLLFPLCGAVAVLVFGTAVMYLWNAIIPDVFTSLKPISFWQAIGILVLAKILFGSFRWGGCGGRWRRRRHNSYWRGKWMNMSEEDKAKMMNWKNMTDEEKAKLKEEWKDKWKGGCC